MSVYLIEEKSTNHVKIGFTSSNNIRGRLSSLQTATPHELVVKTFVQGATQEYEAYLHSKFKHFRVRAEWFRADESVLAYFQDLQNGTRSWEEDLCYDREYKNTIENERNAERRREKKALEPLIDEQDMLECLGVKRRDLVYLEKRRAALHNFEAEGKPDSMFSFVHDHLPPMVIRTKDLDIRSVNHIMGFEDRLRDAVSTGRDTVKVLAEITINLKPVVDNCYKQFEYINTPYKRKEYQEKVDKASAALTNLTKCQNSGRFDDALQI